MNNPCTPSKIVHTVKNNMANVPGVKFGASDYRHIAIVRHEDTHRPKIIRDTKRQMVVTGYGAIHVGRTERSDGFRALARLHEEAEELNWALETECMHRGNVGCV